MSRYYDSCDKELLKSTVIQELRKLGYKNVQKIRKNCQKWDQERHIYSNSKLFRNELSQLASKVVSLKTGHSVEVPTFVADVVALIEENVFTEGIFRKAGSAARQREIKAWLEDGNELRPEYHVIDVANILKLFFRELPEPLIPYSTHEMLIWCLQMKEKTTDCLLLTCLLIPNDHLETLIYFMQFLHQVAENAQENKMDVNNLSIIMAPTLMPVEERKTESMSQNGSRLKNHVKVIELLIKSSEVLGQLPKSIEKKLPVRAQSIRSTVRSSRQSREEGIKKKKRRSGSLTRMLSGLKRMVGKVPSPCKSKQLSNSHKSESPYHFGKKRKALESSVSFNRKKKHDDLPTYPSRSNLPNKPHLNFQQDILMPCNACGLCPSPNVCYDPNVSPDMPKAETCDCELEKKQRIEEDENGHYNLRNNSSKLPLNTVRRWSSMTSSRENKMKEFSNVNSFPSRATHVQLLSDDVVESDEKDCNSNHQKVEPKIQQQELHNGSFFMANLEQEYEKIKIKVSAIENQLIEEFGRLGATVEGHICSVSSNASEDSKGLESVQTKYEKTLEESERFSDSSADHLAKRLSKELKIRRSAEHKIIRSPSARKIGSIRRRSRDSVKQQKLAFNIDESMKNKSETGQIVHCLKQEVLNSSSNSGNDFHSNLKRGRPNTVRTGLRQPSPAQNVDSSRIQLTYVNGETLSSNSMQNGNNSNPVQNIKSQSLGEIPSDVHDSNSRTERDVLPSQWESKIKLMDDFNFATPDILKFKKSDKPSYMNMTPVTPSSLRRASSFQESMETSGIKDFSHSHGDIKKCASFGNVSQDKICDPMSNTAHSTNHHWHSAAHFLSNSNMTEQSETRRESIAKLRAQNAGKVLANVKLFEHNGQARNEKVSSICGTAPLKSRHSINSSHKVVTPADKVQESICNTFCENKHLRLRRSSHGDKPSPKVSLSDSESPHVRHAHFKRQGRLSAPGPGKHSQRYRKCSSSSEHKKSNTVPLQWIEQYKENYIDSHGYTESVIKESNKLKEAVNDVFTPILGKPQSMHLTPLKDNNRMSSHKKGSPFDSSPTDCLSNENINLLVLGGHTYDPQTPYFTASPRIKQPLTSGHSSLRPVSRLKKKTGKASPVRGVHKVFGEGTPRLSPRRKSPRLLLRSRLMSNACM